MIAIISDVHGNYPALKAVLNQIDSIGCSRIFSLGDVAGYYCMLNECIEVLRERDIVNIMGNHDNYIVSHASCPRSNSANRCLEFQQHILSDTNRSWLEGSFPRLDFDDISMVHGGWNDPLDEYLTHIDKGYFSHREGTFFLSGHTHVQIRMDMLGKLYCNPGSVGQPRDGIPTAAFAVLEGQDITLYRVKYDIDLIAFEMNKAGFEPYYYENLYTGCRIGG